MPRLLDHAGSQRARSQWAYLKSFIPFIALILFFSVGLASHSLLSRFGSPAAKQHIGWQAWDVVEIKRPESLSIDNNTEDGGWNPSIPIDGWDPLAVHTTGLTEIAIKSCYLSPKLFSSFCAPSSTPEQDKTMGKWVAVERDLNVKAGLWYLNVYYRRTRRLDAPLISDLRVVPEPVPEDLASSLEGWVKADGNLHSGVWPKVDEARLWYRLKNQTSPEETRSSVYENLQDVITEVDILYGDDDPFYGFQRVEGGKVLDSKEGKWDSVDITYKRGNHVTTKTRPPKFHEDGTLKMMQIADLHYSVGSGSCRDTDKSPCVGDRDTADWLGEALDAEKPDMVVFSGDQLNGQKTSYDARSVLAKFAKPVIDRQIPWAAVFGNHDSEIAQDREVQMRTLQSMPYSLSKLGPKDVDGFGNYMIKLRSADPSRMHIFTLYFLDSHDYQSRTLPWATPDYDYIKPSQIEWFLNTSQTIQPIERPFRPDGAEDLGHIWRRSQPERIRQDQAKTLAKPNAMMWFHIPLPEAYDPADISAEDGSELNLGDQFDGTGSSKHNSGFFEKAVKVAMEASAQESAFSTSEVKVLSHGHCHNTDRCRRVKGIWMCFDGGSSYSGYGQVDFDRRVRIYQISDYGETVETYKRLTSGETIDRQILVGTGAAADAGRG